MQSIEDAYDEFEKYSNNLVNILTAAGIVIAEPDAIAKVVNNSSSFNEEDKTLAQSSVGGIKIESSKELRHLLIELFVNKEVDNLLCFLSEIAAAILVIRREGFENVKVGLRAHEIIDYVTDERSHDDIVKHIACLIMEKKSYGGLKEIENFFWESLRIKTGTVDKKVREDVEILIGVRNVIVHQRGRVGTKLKEIAKLDSCQLGERVGWTASDTLIRFSEDRISSSIKSYALSIRDKAIKQYSGTTGDHSP